MYKKNYEILRGDPANLICYVPGDVTTQKLIFVVKASKDLTGDRLIEKKNTAAGGSDDEIIITYANGKTKITVKLLKEDTQDFIETTYYHDTTSQPIGNATDPVTVSGGTLTIDKDVQSPFDGTNLPAAAERLVPILASQLTAGKLLKVGTNDYTNSTNTDAEVADAVTKKHAHSNKTLLDTYIQTESDLANAVSLKHSHINKTVLDSILQAHLDSIEREDALYNYLFNGVLDENNTILNLDENNFIIQLDEGVK